MILFPDFDMVERDSDEIKLEQYKQQYYFSKLAILNFCSKIPNMFLNQIKLNLNMQHVEA